MPPNGWSTTPRRRASDAVFFQRDVGLRGACAGRLRPCRGAVRPISRRKRRRTTAPQSSFSSACSKRAVRVASSVRPQRGDGGRASARPRSRRGLGGPWRVPGEVQEVARGTSSMGSGSGQYFFVGIGRLASAARTRGSQQRQRRAATIARRPPPRCAEAGCAMPLRRIVSLKLFAWPRASTAAADPARLMRPTPVLLKETTPSRRWQRHARRRRRAQRRRPRRRSTPKKTPLVKQAKAPRPLLQAGDVAPALRARRFGSVKGGREGALGASTCHG